MSENTHTQETRGAHCNIRLHSLDHHTLYIFFFLKVDKTLYRWNAHFLIALIIISCTSADKTPAICLTFIDIVLSCISLVYQLKCSILIFMLVVNFVHGFKILLLPSRKSYKGFLCSSTLVVSLADRKIFFSFFLPQSCLCLS